MLKRLLSHPLTRGLDLDDPRTTELRLRIIRDKPFLEKIYLEWYGAITAALPAGSEPVLEIGSGAGFFRELVTGVISSDVFNVPGLSMILDAHTLPFADASLRAVVMTDVFHHVSTPELFLREAARCVRPDGRVVMIEPWVTGWSRFVWGRLHHEPFEPESPSWSIPRQGPLSGANGALPWILFERDRSEFERRLPQWKIASIEISMPFRYLLAGGVSLRSLMPGWSFSTWRWLEQRLAPWMSFWATYAKIVLVRR